MTLTPFLFWLVIYGGPLGLIAWIMWQHIREARRRRAYVGMVAAGIAKLPWRMQPGETVLFDDRRFTLDEIYRQNEGRS